MTVGSTVRALEALGVTAEPVWQDPLGASMRGRLETTTGAVLQLLEPALGV